MINIVVVMDMGGLVNGLEKKKEVLKKNIVKTRSEAEKKLYELGRNAIARSTSKARKKTKTKLFDPEGNPIKKSLSSFLQGKKIGKGTLPGQSVTEPQNQQSYKWTKTKPGKATSHVSGREGRDDHWLRNAIRTQREGETIYVYVNPDAGRGVASEAGQLMPQLVEQGGSYHWSRNIPVGYTVETYSGILTKRGNGKTLNKADKKSEMRVEDRVRTSVLGKKFKAGSHVRAERMKNRSGKSRAAHFRKFKEPRVSFRKKFERLNKTSPMPKKSFIEPAIKNFLEKHFGLIAEKALEGL